MSVWRAYSGHYRSQLECEEVRRNGIEWPPKDKYDVLLDLLLIGDSGVGKAHFTTRFCRDCFDSRFPLVPITLLIPQHDVRKVFVDEKLVKIQLWNIHGEEHYIRYRSSPGFQWHRSKGFIIIYDITNQDSFESVPGWLEVFEAERFRDTVKFLVGNKADLSKDQRKVPTDVAIEFAHQHDMLFFETSCKDGTNVELAVMTMVAKIMEGTSRKTEKQAKIR